MIGEEIVEEVEEDYEDEFEDDQEPTPRELVEARHPPITPFYPGGSSVYDKARNIEGASQRVQEDTIKFSRIMEGLGTSLIESVLVLVEFFVPCHRIYT